MVGVDGLLDACRRCFASLFTDRAIEYRAEQGFGHLDVALSVGVQVMVRADQAGAGVMFSIDTETGFPDVVVIDAAWGLGEAVVGGTVDPDEYVVFKPLLSKPDFVPVISKCRGAKAQMVAYDDRNGSTRVVDCDDEQQAGLVLDDDEICLLARQAVAIEEHYGQPMDIEWAKDGPTGQLYVVQARPETVQHRRRNGRLRVYELAETDATPLVTGAAIGQSIASGPVVVLTSPEDGDRFPDSGVLVTEMTDPDWVPLMRRAAAIVTDRGGRTSHAAIVSRELGVPAVIGTGDATSVLDDDTTVTVSCAEGDEGHVYDGEVAWDVREVDVEDLPRTRTKIMLNLADPAAALRWWRLPADGVGLTRIEFIVGNLIGIHPMALAQPDLVGDESVRDQIQSLTMGYEQPADFFVEQLAFGIARIAASQHPRPVIVRLSDLKSNEYADLVGGSELEPHESNPMLGWRGASRYHHDHYRPGFDLECKAIMRVRDEMGLRNVVVMVPFCRTVEEADRVLDALADAGLVRGRHGLQIYVMAEIPSNALLADEFAARFDGFSIGSNDLTQLVLGVDRDSAELRQTFDESDPAVVRAIEMVIEGGHAGSIPVGLCGEGPSNDAGFAELLVKAGIDSISIAPDRFLAVKQLVSEIESREGADVSARR